MARKITVYQVWHGEDMALSDAWFATLKQARQHIADSYGVPKSRVKLAYDPEFPSSLTWDGEADDGYDIHCTAIEIEMTAEGVCDALTHLPNR